MSDNVKIKATIYWANLNVVNELSNKYQIILGDLSDAAVAKLEDMGLDVGEKDGQGKYITCKSANPIRAFDNDGLVVPADILVANGSKAVAVIKPYEWKYKNKKGLSPSLVKLQITELIEYVGGGGSIDDGEEAL